MRGCGGGAHVRGGAQLRHASCRCEERGEGRRRVSREGKREEGRDERGGFRCRIASIMEKIPSHPIPVPSQKHLSGGRGKP